MAVAAVTFEDEFADGAVLVIEKKFRDNPQVYLYAAIKTNGRWYITGSQRATTASYSTDGFISWLLNGWDHEVPPRLFWAREVFELEAPQ